MNTNPYQAPLAVPDEAAEPGQPGQSGCDAGDPLRGPALGCLVTGLLGLLLAAAMIADGTRWLSRAKEAGSQEMLREARDNITAGWMTIPFCLLAWVVAVCMLRRRWRWLVLSSSIVGLVVMIPAPLAAIILMRLRRREIWESFDAHRAADVAELPGASR